MYTGVGNKIIFKLQPRKILNILRLSLNLRFATSVGQQYNLKYCIHIVANLLNIYFY
jgi:hypothetical protein